MNKDLRVQARAGRRSGLTLIELVVVLVILAALAALIVPRLSGVASQSYSATNAATVEEVNRAVGMFEARYAADPNKKLNGWDSLLNTSDELYSKLHPNLTQTSDVTKPSLQVSTLTALQAQSLQDAKVNGFHDAVETRVSTPSDNSTQFRFLAAGTKVVTLQKTPIADGHGSTFIDNAFNINQFKKNWNYEFVVCGLGGPTSLKGSTLTEIPLVQSADPARYYARVLCVFMVPGTTTTGAVSFPAQYVGCFLPDGTSLRNNVDKFNSSNVTAN